MRLFVIRMAIALSAWLNVGLLEAFKEPHTCGGKIQSTSLPTSIGSHSSIYFTPESMLFRQAAYAGTLPTTGANIDVTQANQIAERIFKVHPNLNRTRHNADLFHGSSSASLLSFTENQDKRGQLQATGLLEQEGKAPFGGEISFGRHGVNQDGVSVVWLGNIRSARRYALPSNLNPWNPEIGKQQIERAKKDQTSKKYPEDSPYQKALKNTIEINEARLREWKSLNEVERDLIQNPFPILYGIRVSRDNALTRISSDVPGEIKLNGGTVNDEIRVIFVPISQVARVREIVKNSKNPNVRVEALEEALAFVN